MRAALLVALLVLGSRLVPAAEAPLAKLAAHDFAALDAQLSAARAGYRPEAAVELALWDLYRLFALPAVRTEDVKAWLAAAPESYDAHLAAAMHYRGLGWNARGTAFAIKTTRTRFAEAHEHFGAAMAHARRSLDLAPRPALSHAMIVDLDRHTGGREQAEASYAAALEAEPGSYLVRSQRLGILQPRWGGSTEAMSELVGEARAAGLPGESVSRLDALRHVYLAMIDEDTGALRPALALAERSLALHETAFAQEARGRLLRKLGDLAGAQSAFERAAQLDPLDADVPSKLGYVLWRRGERPAALEHYKRAALLGHGWSANEAGLLLLHGGAGRRSPREAFDWFALGARLGSPEAMHGLGECYVSGACGADVKVDHALALHWFRRAEAYGDDFGTLGVAYMLWDGLGTPRDDGEAVRLWRRTLRSENDRVREAARLNLAHLVDLRRGVPALVQASGYPVLATGMFAAMALLPLLALVFAVRDGAIALSRRAPDPRASRVIGARGLLWAVAWLSPPLVGTVLWAAFAFDYLSEFLVVLPLFALLCAPSLLILYVIGTGEWQVRVDGERLRYERAGRAREIAWADIESVSRASGSIRIVTRSRQVHELDGWPFGETLWREIEARRTPA